MSRKLLANWYFQGVKTERIANGSSLKLNRGCFCCVLCVLEVVVFCGVLCVLEVVLIISTPNGEGVVVRATLTVKHKKRPRLLVTTFYVRRQLWYH